MKAVVQKPIQSLNASGRHNIGGRAVALPLFIDRKWIWLITGLALVLLMAVSTAAQDDTGNNGNSERQLDQLFEQIMGTLPQGVQAKVDSASGSSRQRENDLAAEHAARMHADAPSPESRLKELPDELKAQVERAISDMEQRQEERKLQFRELKHKK